MSFIDKVDNFLNTLRLLKYDDIIENIYFQNILIGGRIYGNKRSKNKRRKC
jgi:hypothetical protein